jgi:hypothetical protein
MTYQTVEQLLTKVKNDLDLNEETFITETELIGYVNAAINRAEQLILGIHEDYFLTCGDLVITDGSRNVTLPTDIYAHKLRKLFYVNGTNKYEIKRLRQLSLIPDIEDTNDYQYVLANSLSSGVQIKLYPQARETLTITDGIWYLRNARTVTATSDSVDLPEASNFILQFVKNECKKKELMGEVTQTMKDDLDTEESQLVTTLTAMVPDENNEILLNQAFLDDSGF